MITVLICTFFTVNKQLTLSRGGWKQLYPVQMVLSTNSRGSQANVTGSTWRVKSPFKQANRAHLLPFTRGPSTSPTTGSPDWTSLFQTGTRPRSKSTQSARKYSNKSCNKKNNIQIRRQPEAFTLRNQVKVKLSV